MRNQVMDKGSPAEVLFFAALEEAGVAERVAYLDRACAGNDILRRRVEALLEAHIQAGQFLERAIDGAEAISALEDAEIPTLDLAFLAPSTDPVSLGRLDHYEVLEVVGHGGTGVVLRARDTKLLRTVAIKVLSTSLAASTTARQRFAREARATAAIRDDHVVPIYAVHDNAAIPYFVMEFINGPSLDALLRDRGPLEVEEALRIGIQVASGLAAAHRQGLIHRDVKPANILLEQSVGRVMLTDFGLARAADDASLTQSGIIAGTPLYMSPEQAAGDPFDVRSDLFSLGSVLYELSGGQPAFRAPSSVAVIRRVCDDKPQPLRELNPDLPEPLGQLIDRLHSKNPADRPNSATEIAERLSAILANLENPSLEPPACSLSEAKPASGARGKRTPIWGWAAVALAVLTGGAGLGLSEATGVTNVRGTVIRLLFPEGTLVLEIDDPGVSVNVEGADVVITGAGVKELRLKAGQYKVEASRDGKVVHQELVAITRDGRPLVRISKEAVPVVDSDAWEKSVAVLPAEKQVEAVERRLRELNPEFLGKVTGSIRNGVVWRLEFLSDRVTNISPLRALRQLESLDCGGSAPRRGRLSDLTPLRGLRLRRLRCAESQVSDLEALRGMPLEMLHCEQTGVESLSPLEGMKLTTLTIQGTGVTDLRPLQGMPLRWLDIFEAVGVADLLPLVGMPLEYLNLTGVAVNNLSPLSSIKTLRILILDGTRITNLEALRPLRLERISLSRTAVTDLSPVQGMPLTQIRLDFRPEWAPLIRSLTRLQFVNDLPVNQFWKEVDTR